MAQPRRPAASSLCRNRRQGPLHCSDDRTFRHSLRAATGPVMSSALADPQASFSHPSLKVVYFISVAFDYSEAIYPGIGPAFAKSYGWPVDTIDHIGTAE